MEDELSIPSIEFGKAGCPRDTAYDTMASRRRLSTKTCVVVSKYVLSISKLVRKNFSMTDIKTIIQCIIRELEEVNKPPYLEKFNDAPNKIPGFISTGEGGSLLVNQTIETNITKVTDW